MRLAGLWIVLVAAYAAMLAIPERPGQDYAGAEPHHLLAAASLVDDHDLDLRNQYRDRAYADLYTSSRVASISVAMFASLLWIAWYLEIGRPIARRSLA